MRYLALWHPQTERCSPDAEPLRRDGAVNRGNDESRGLAGYRGMGSEGVGHPRQELRRERSP